MTTKNVTVAPSSGPSVTATGAERREHARQKVSRVEVRVASKESLRASYLRDLSLGGLFVRSQKPLPVSTAVVIELAVEAQAPLRLRGEVVRHETNADGTFRGFGVRFSTVDLETKVALEAIIAAHTEAPVKLPEASDRTELEAQLAEARGTIEAYEETLAQLRESEMEAVQRLESTEAERTVLANVAQELQTRLQSADADRSHLRSALDALMERLTRGEAETRQLRDSSTKLSHELKAAHAAMAQAAAQRSDEVAKLASQLEAEMGKSTALQAEFDAEMRSLKQQLETRDDSTLRRELQELSAQLDDERLKAMALQRALQRFVEMGGVIPPRG
jgi:uncharacterized protein (TIGR02266 family)